MSKRSNSDYLLGSSDAEHERLIRQATLIAPFTERFFRQAGIRPGQHVLDVGSGVGDVAMLVGKLVGPSGEVVGIERDERSLARARARAKKRGRTTSALFNLILVKFPSISPLTRWLGDSSYSFYLIQWVSCGRLSNCCTLEDW